MKTVNDSVFSPAWTQAPSDSIEGAPSIAVLLKKVKKITKKTGFRTENPSFQSKERLLVQDQLSQIHGIHDLAVLVYAHVAAGDLIDEDDFVIVVAELELDIPKVETD